MIEKILGLKKKGKTDTEIGEELKLSRQKVGALIKKHEFEEANKASEDEFPAEMFAKKSNVIKDPSMGGSVVLTADEYHEFSEANGRYQGRKEGQKTRLDSMELRVAITEIQKGDRSAVDVRNQAMNKHGINEAELKTVCFKLTNEEEVGYMDVIKSLGLKK